MSFLRRRISQLNFPPRLFWIGIFVLFVNAALPAIYRVLHESKVGTKPDWGAAYETNQYIWWLVVPLLCALSNAVPWSPSGANNFWPQRRWLPLGLFGLWLAGTGVHLYCLGYVYDFALRPELLAPALWTLGWTLYLKTDQLLPGQEERYKNALWVLPTIATLFAAPQPEKAVFLLLTAINMSIFGVLYKRRRIPLALHLGILSTVALVAGLPEAWARSLAPQFNRESFVWGAAVLYVLIWIAGSCDPKLGILGAVLAAVSVGYVTNQPHATHWAAQTGLAFLLAHSLRWIDSEAEGASLLRWLAALAWVVHSLAWTHLYEAGWRVCIVALSVVAVFIILRWFCKKWGPMAIPAASLLVLLSAPGHIAASQLESTPAGLLAVIGSFILFALGTLAALTKQRWKCS